MAGMTIEWHEKCLANSKNYQENLEQQLAKMQDKVRDIKARNDTYQRQIDRAKSLNKASFDAERFKV